MQACTGALLRYIRIALRHTPPFKRPDSAACCILSSADLRVARDELELDGLATVVTM